MRYLMIILLITFSFSIFGQQKSNQDTTLTKLLKGIPKENQKAFIKMYKTMSLQGREFILLMSELPTSSKKELITNVDTNYKNIFELKLLLEKSTPTGSKIYIEFQPSEKLLNQGESIDLWVWKTDSSGQEINLFQEWNIELTSNKLDSLLNIIDWDRIILEQIRVALKKANCISIKTGEPTEIGFARSGMGKYFYVIFMTNLTEEKIKEFNDGCSYIFYKENIVLMYGGGAIGPQCFPDKD